MGQGATDNGVDNSIVFGQGASTGGADSVAMGQAANASGDNSVAVGKDADATGLSTVAVGNDADATGETSVAIGGSSDASAERSIALGPAASVATASSIAIGDNASILSGLGGGIAIGASSAANGQEAVAIGIDTAAAGTGDIAIGASSNVSIGAIGGIAIGASAVVNSGAHYSIALGKSAVATAVSQLVIGSETGPINVIFLGEGVSSDSPGHVSVNVSGASGTNIGSGDLQLNAGRSTGTGAGGNLILQTSRSGSTGTSLNALVTDAQIDSNGGVFGRTSIQAVTSQVDATTTTLADITGLSATLTGGRTYLIRLMLFLETDTTGGYKVGVDGGTATAVTFIADFHQNTLGSPATVVGSRFTALNNNTGNSGGAGYEIQVTAYLKVNAGGTFEPQFAQLSANNTSSVLVGSTMDVQEILPTW